MKKLKEMLSDGKSFYLYCFDANIFDRFVLNSLLRGLDKDWKCVKEKRMSVFKNVKTGEKAGTVLLFREGKFY